MLYLEAASALDDREARIAAVAEKLETNFELIGVTAIEDKLQVRCNNLVLSVLLRLLMPPLMLPLLRRGRAWVVGFCDWYVSDCSCTSHRWLLCSLAYV